MPARPKLLRGYLPTGARWCWWDGLLAPCSEITRLARVTSWHDRGTGLASLTTGFTTQGAGHCCWSLRKFIGGRGARSHSTFCVFHCPGDALLQLGHITGWTSPLRHCLGAAGGFGCELCPSTSLPVRWSTVRRRRGGRRVRRVLLPSREGARAKNSLRPTCSIVNASGELTGGPFPRCSKKAHRRKASVA